jgi:hypothetical protein
MPNEETAPTIIHEISADLSESPGMYCIQMDDQGFDAYRFYDGKLIEDWPKDITLICVYQYEEDILLGELHWKIVSERVRKVFENLEIQGVQFLPVSVIDSNFGKKIGQYWALNVIQTSPSLKLEDIKDLDIFRLKAKGGRTATFISERVKQKLESIGAIKGMYFIQVPSRIIMR